MRSSQLSRATGGDNNEPGLSRLRDLNSEYDAARRVYTLAALQELKRCVQKMVMVDWPNPGIAWQGQTLALTWLFHFLMGQC